MTGYDLLKDLPFAKQAELARKQKRRTFITPILVALWLAAYYCSVFLPTTILVVFYNDWLDADIALGFSYWGAIIGLVGTLIIWVIIWVSWERKAQWLFTDERLRRAKTTALLEALAAPDESTMPTLSTEPPTMVTLADVPHIQAHPSIGTRNPLLDGRKLWTMLFPVIIGLEYLISLSQPTLQTILTNSLLQTTNQHSAFVEHFGFWNWLPIWLMLGLLVIFVLSLRQQIIGQPPKMDQMGIWWTRLSRWEYLPWSELRTIGCYPLEIDGKPIAGVERYENLYVLAADNQVITWMSPYYLADKRHALTDKILSYAMSFSGLPLRNLGPLANTLAAETTKQEAVSPAVREAMANLLAAQPPTKQLTLNVPLHWLRFLVVAPLVFGVLITPYIGLHWVHDVAQPRYLKTLPTDLRARKPMFQDVLLTANGLWPTHQPTATDFRDIAYTPTGYRLRGNVTGNAVTAVLPQLYGAVALQVTVTESGEIPPNTYDGVGIIYRQDIAPNPMYCAFVIDYAGTWSDTCDYENSHKHNAAINQGPNATNTLLVVERANFAAFYVNGQYVGQFFTTWPYLGTLAHVGLINQETGMSATFHDFTIWPLTMPPDLSYVA